MMIEVISTLILIYFTSVIICYRWISIAHSKNGLYPNTDADGIDLFYTFMPMINTGLSIYCLFCSPYKETQEKVEDNFNKFFRVKK